MNRERRPVENDEAASPEPVEGTTEAPERHGQYTAEGADLRGIRHEWAVFPIPRGTKAPNIPWRDLSRPIDEWGDALADSNIGIDCGKSGLVVLDEDRAGAIAEVFGEDGLPETYEVRTDRGRHLYFRQPEGVPITNAAAHLPAGLDVRGEGGLVVAAGSIHPSATMYEVVRDMRPARFPDHLVAILRGDESATIEVDLSRARERFELPEIIPEGERNSTLHRYACSLVARRVPRSRAIELLTTAQRRNCRPAYTERTSEQMLDHAADQLAKQRTPQAPASGDNGREAGTWGASRSNEPQNGAECAPSGWDPVDVGEVVDGYLSGSLARERPVIGRLGLVADDSPGALFYAGRVNGIAGESNSGKTWTAIETARQELEAGRVVVFVDFEDSAQGIITRLLDAGACAETVKAALVYIAPTESLDAIAWQRMATLLDEQEPSLVVIDSTGEALSTDGANPNADDEVAAWFRAVPRRIARHAAGPAVVVLDHITKAAATEGGLWPIGSQRKRAAIDGAQYMQRQLVSFDARTPGHAQLTVAKDRHGAWRTKRKVANLHVAPGDSFGAVRLELVEVPDPTASASGSGAFRPTGLMEKVSRYLETNDDDPSERTKAKIGKYITGKREYINAAADRLVEEGYADRRDGARGAHVYGSIKPYREADDPKVKR